MDMVEALLLARRSVDNRRSCKPARWADLRTETAAARHVKAEVATMTRHGKSTTTRA